MVTGIFISQDATKPLELRELNGLSDYQRIVGGYVEVVHIDFPRLTIFVNDEGKVQRLEINRRATGLWWLLSPGVRGRDVLVGDVVIVGAKRGPQSTTDVPDQFRALLLETSEYRTEFKLVGDPRTWHPDSSVFSTYFEAAIYSLSRLERVELLQEVRVVGNQ